MRTIDSYSLLKQKLLSIGQEHLLQYWGQLDPQQQADLAQQISHLDVDTFAQQKSLLISPKSSTHPIERVESATYASAYDQTTLGQRLIAEGKVGALIIAGGQGSRLRFEGPKGCFPISPIKAKSLFQIFAEKTTAASQQAGRLLPLAIMTSPLNHQETLNFFRENNFFGLNPSQIDFFSQENLPLLTLEGQLFLETTSQIACGPNGNGKALTHFFQSGLWQKWRAQGVEYLNFIQIDNPLADPFDPNVISYAYEKQCEVAIKCVERHDPHESVGILAQKGNEICVVEYSEISESERLATQVDGSLKHPFANISLFCFSMSFIEKIGKLSSSTLPLHLAKKAVKYLNTHGKTEFSQTKNAWKFEAFIFDVLHYSQRTELLVYSRANCFAPLKNASGPDSVESVKAALTQRDKQVFKQLTCMDVTASQFELSQSFHYPTEELKQKISLHAHKLKLYLEQKTQENTPIYLTEEVLKIVCC